jgi:hypothetical protein
MIKPVKIPIVKPDKQVKVKKQKLCSKSSEVKTAMRNHCLHNEIEISLTLLPFAFCLLPCLATLSPKASGDRGRASA